MSDRPADGLIEWGASRPWAVYEPALREYLSIAQRLGDGPEAVAARLGRKLENTHQVTNRDGVAVVPIDGPIFRHADMFTEVSGAVSVERLALDLRTAIDDAQIKAVVLNVDSPGGEMNGIHELAGQIRAAATVKPVWAYVGGKAASGGYWLASAASRVVVDRTALLGSIGVIMSLVDDAPVAREGRPKSYRFVSSQSPDKRPDLETDAGRLGIQTMVDRLGAEFIGSVALHRNVTAEHVLEHFGRGGLLVGADAVAAGMADELGSFESVVRAIVTAKPGRPVSAPPIGATGTMFTSSTLATAAAALPVEQRCQAQWDRDPAIRAEFGSLGAFTAYARAEECGQVTSVASRAVRMSTPALPVEQRCQAQWDRNPAIRAEFGSLETFVAFTAADERGAVRIKRTA